MIYVSSKKNILNIKSHVCFTNYIKLIFICIWKLNFKFNLTQLINLVKFSNTNLKNNRFFKTNFTTNESYRITHLDLAREKKTSPNVKAEQLRVKICKKWMNIKGIAIDWATNGGIMLIVWPKFLGNFSKSNLSLPSFIFGVGQWTSWGLKFTFVCSYDYDLLSFLI